MKKNRNFFTDVEERTALFVALLVLILAGTFIVYMVWPGNESSAKKPIATERNIPAPALQEATDDTRETVLNSSSIQEDSFSSKAEVIQGEDSLRTKKMPGASLETESDVVTTLPSPKFESPKLETLNRGNTPTLPRHEEPASNALMIVHSFEIEKNASRFADQLRADGYEVEMRRHKKGWHSVGVAFNDEVIDQEGLRQALSDEYDAVPELWQDPR